MNGKYYFAKKLQYNGQALLRPRYVKFPPPLSSQERECRTQAPPFSFYPQLLISHPLLFPTFLSFFFFELSFFSFLSRTSSQQQVARPGKRRRRKERKENEIRKGEKLFIPAPLRLGTGDHLLLH